MSRAVTAKPRFGVFAEGAPPTAADLSTFETLWFELSESCGGDRDAIRLYGFNKGQIRALKGAPDSTLKGQGVEPLDVLISRMHDRDGFENAIIAFDRWPRNEAILSPPYCLRTEVNFILEALERRGILPARFLAAATALLERYRNFRKNPRAADRPPLGPLEFLYMDPMFEGLLVHDERLSGALSGSTAPPENGQSSKRIRASRMKRSCVRPSRLRQPGERYRFPPFATTSTDGH